MWLSDRQSVSFAKLMFRFKQTSGRLRKSLLRGLAKLLGAIWSFRGALGLIAAALIFSLINLLYSVHGKLVVLPFEVYSDQGDKENVGAAFAAALAARLNDYIDLYPSNSLKAMGQKITRTQNYSDIIEVFMTELCRHPSIFSSE